jgi:hypothetical protein
MGIISGHVGSQKKKGSGALITAMNQLVISGAAPTYNSVSTAWGWAGPGASLSTSNSPLFSINLTGKTFANGLRIILQSGGGSSSNNDGDGDSSGNSGATSVFTIPASGLTGTLNIYVGACGPSYSTSGGAQQNVNPRQISGITNPLGAQSVSPGQGSYAGNASYDAAVLLESVILGYAEGGGATPNYDSPNSYQSRAYVNTSYVTNVATTPGPVSPGRSAAAGNTSYPLFNFRQVSDYGTCYGKYSSIDGGRYGQGGTEAYLGGAGTNGFPAFIWISIL